MFKFEKYDRQFLFFVLQNVFTGVCGMIDTGFGNRINLDCVCVLSAYTIITWMTYAIYSIGSYAYRVAMKKPKTCLYMQIAVSVVLGILLFAAGDIIPHIYSLTDTQYHIFTQCLRVHAIGLPALAAGEFLSSYSEYSCKNKEGITGNILFYIIMIVLDAAVVVNHMGLAWLIASTVVCYVIYDIYMYIVLGLRKEVYDSDISEIKTLFKHGFNICFDRITGKIATIVFNIYASRLGTKAYAIHAVCYAIGNFTENFTNALCVYETVELAKTREEHRFKHCVMLTKKYAGFILVSGYLVSYLLLLFTHGSVPVKSCILYTGLYCTQLFTVTVYESMKAYLTSQKQTQYLKYGGVIGILVRIPVTVIGYHMGLGLLPFALGSTVDFAARGLYWYACSRKHENAGYMKPVLAVKNNS